MTQQKKDGPGPGGHLDPVAPRRDRHYGITRSAACRVPSVRAIATYIANPNRVQHTHAVDCAACGGIHLHHVRTLDPVVRKPQCGGPRYRILVARSVRLPRPRPAFELVVSA